MRQIQIIQYMIQVVENYIFAKKHQRVSINTMQIINNERQINMLIDAYNHIKTEYPNV
jgi:hypothetical protein